MRNKLLFLTIITSLAFLSLQFQSCQPDGNQPPEPDTLYLEQDFMEYTYLPVGAYWIYRNVETGELDSCYSRSIFRKSKDDIFFEDIYSPPKYRLEEREAQITLRGTDYLCEWYMGSPGQKNESAHFLMSNYDDQISKVIGRKLSGTEWIENSKPWENYYVFWHDRIQFENKKYYDIVQIDVSDSWEARVPIKSIYLERNIGPIFLVFPDKSEWELIRYNR